MLAHLHTLQTENRQMQSRIMELASQREFYLAINTKLRQTMSEHDLGKGLSYIYDIRKPCMTICVVFIFILLLFYYIHFVLYMHLYYICTCIIYAPVLYMHLHYICTCIIYAPVLYMHLYYICTCIKRIIMLYFCFSK